MTFANAQWLWLTVVPFLALGLILIGPTVARALRGGRTAKHPRVLFFSGYPSQINVQTRRLRWLFRGLMALGVTSAVLIAIALARPVRFTTEVKKDSEGIDIVLVFDVSESMDAIDFEPNRMVVAKQVISGFIGRRSQDRIGIVTFGGEAITKAPLTRDHDFLLEQIEEIKMRELKQGTAIGMGLANGISRLRTSEAKTKVIVLITDGDSNVGSINPITAANLAKQQGIRVYTVGIGKEDRVIVPIYAYDAYGKRNQLVAQIPSYLNPALLQEVAQITGGKAFMARDPGALNNILMEIDKLERSALKLSPVHRTEENFLPFALIGFLGLFCFYLLQETRLRRAELGPAL